MLRPTVLVALVALAAPVSAMPIPQQPDTAALAGDIPRIMRISDVPGLSIAMVQNGCVTWTGAFGTLNDSAKTPLDASTIFEAASLSNRSSRISSYGWPSETSSISIARCSRCSRILASRTTSDTGGSPPEWSSRTARVSPTGVVKN